MNKKNAEFFISDSKGFALKVDCALSNMTAAFVASKMIPAEILEKRSLEACPHCGGGEKRD